MADNLSLEQKFNLITQRIPKSDVHGENTIRSALENGSRRPRCLWATSPTGKPHIGYFIPLLKFADFLKAGVDIVVLLLDVYSFLDNVKYDMEQVVQRMHYYKFIVTAALEALGIPSSKIQFVQESSYQISKRFVVDQWKLCTLVPQQDVKDAWDRSYNPSILSPMLCPGLQALAEEHLDIDFQFGGTDQRGLFAFADRFLPKLGYKKRAHLMNPMLPNLLGQKMSSSHPPSTKIMFLDSPEAVSRKINEASWGGHDPAKNGLLASLRDILIPVSKLRLERLVNTSGKNGINGLNGVNSKRPFRTEDAPEGTLFTVLTENGSPGLKHFKSYDEIEQELVHGTLSQGDLKKAVSNAFNNLLDPIRKAYKLSEEWQAVDKLAYPVEEQYVIRSPQVQT